ncbi:hypothetical protein FQA39_LY09509 [Lamprigera yunnana]|nr:hypothetical protein FQA39_LY09509 [Lamprigera yunnana]
MRAVAGSKWVGLRQDIPEFRVTGGIKPGELGVKPEWVDRVEKAESPAVQRELGRGFDLSEVRRTYKGKIASLLTWGYYGFARVNVGKKDQDNVGGNFNSNGEPIYRKVAVVENFFDIIYNVHVELEGRPGKHAGQKRTYRTITETYAFLPREAVTRFLLGCTDCQRHPRSPSPVSVLPTPSPSPTLPLVPTTAPVLPLATLPQASQPTISQSVPSQLTPPTSQTGLVVDPQCEISYLDFGKHTKTSTECKTSQPISGYVTSNISTQIQTLDLSQKNVDISQSQPKLECPLRNGTPEPKRSSNPLDVCNLTSRDPPKSPPKKRHLNHLSDNSQPLPVTPKLWSPVDGIEREQAMKKQMMMPAEIDYSLPITTTYLKYMRSLGCTDEDALKFENKNVSRIIDNFLHDAISHYFY